MTAAVKFHEPYLARIFAPGAPCGQGGDGRAGGVTKKCENFQKCPYLVQNTDKLGVFRREYGVFSADLACARRIRAKNMWH